MRAKSHLSFAVDFCDNCIQHHSPPPGNIPRFITLIYFFVASFCQKEKKNLWISKLTDVNRNTSS